MNITVEKSEDSQKYILRSSPNQNTIRFIKNKTLNTRKKRVYAVAEIALNRKIPEHILEYMREKGIKEEEAAYIEYIETKKTPLRTRHHYSPNTFTTLYNENNVINESNHTRMKYYNVRNQTYILTKGYGRKLLQQIEISLKKEGLRYLLLIPSRKWLLKYYTGLGYKIDTTGVVNHVNENNHKNEERVPANLVMYKDLESNKVEE